MTTTNTIKPKRIISMFNLSLPLSNAIYVISGGLIIIGAVFGLIGTIGAIWSGALRERYADARLSDNEKETAQAKSVAALANEQTAQLKIEASGLAIQLEKEKTTRLELEQAVAPRIMEQYKSSEALKKIPGVTAIITNIPDIESQRMAGQLAATLSMAGWKYKFVPYNPSDIYPDGVVIEKNVGAIPEDDLSPQATEILLEQLKNNKIESRYMPARDLPPNTIVIKVGFKPYTFFSDKINPKENIRVHGNMILPK